MNRSQTTEPSVHDSRFDYEADEIVRGMIRAEDLAMSPEEYAAHHAHEWGCFSFHLCRYRDPILEAWVKRFGEILFSAETLERCRTEWLNPDEIARIRREEAEGF